MIRARGSDAARFLHGQLSNDFEKLDAQHARLAAYCSPQGRMLASFVAVRPAADDIWLACSADVLQPVLKRLSMFVLRSQVRLADTAAELAVLGAAGPAAQRMGAGLSEQPWQCQRTAGDGALVRLPPAAGLPGVARALWIGPAEAAAALLHELPPLAPQHWLWLEVASGVVHVNAASSGQFVPQMLNYELVGGVDFKKGCYPGQEVVARSQYLGKLKRRAYRLHAAGPVTDGTEVYASGDAGQPAGRVALAAPHPHSGFDAIVELKTAALADGSLHLGSPQGPVLELRDLPYAVPTTPSDGPPGRTA